MTYSISSAIIRRFLLKSSMKGIFLAIALFFSGLFSPHVITKTVVVTRVVTPTPTPTPTVIPVPTVSQTQYLDETVKIQNCQTGQTIQVKRSDLPKYGISVNTTSETNPCSTPQPVRVIYMPPPYNPGIHCTTSYAYGGGYANTDCY